MVRCNVLCLTVLSLCIVLLSSCASMPKQSSANASIPVVVPETPLQEEIPSEPETEWTFCDSIEDLCGIWECADGTGFEYPFTADYRTYIRFFSAWQDVTESWQYMAASQKITMEQLWQKRSTIYGWQNPRTRKYASLPLADDGGVQKGVKFRRMAGRVYVRDEYLITEFVLGKNLRHFLMSEDKDSFRTDGTLHLLSSVFSDLKGTGNIYVRNGAESGQGGL